MTTNSQAIKALGEIGISINDVNGDVKSATQIISEMAEKWDTLSDSERQMTSVRVAGVNQQNRLNALMLNYSTALSATQTSIHSQNSAMNEQDKFSQSLEGRINRLRTAWTGFAATAGGTTLYDSIVVLTSAFQGATNGAGWFVNFIGIMGPSLGIASMALVGLNTNLRTSIINMSTVAKSTYQASGAVGLFGKASAMATAGVTALKGATTALLATAGVGIVFLGIGFAIEKLTKVISKNIQEQEKFDASMKKNADAMGTNKDAVDRLISEYNDLSQAKEDAGGKLNTEQEQQYLDVQTRLSQMFPALIDHIDSSGQAHLKTSDAIKEEIAGLEKLETARQKALVAGAEDEFKDILTDVTGSWYESLNNYLYGSLETRIKETKQILKAVQENNPTNTDKIAELDYELVKLETQYAQATQEIIAMVNEVSDATLNGFKIDPVVTKSLDEFINKLDFSKLNEKELKTFSVAYGELKKKMMESLTKGNSLGFAEAEKELNNLVESMSLATPKTEKLTLNFSELKEAMKNGTSNAYVDGEAISDYGDKVKSASEQVQNHVDKLKDLSSTQERIVGVSQAQTKEVTDSIMVISQLGNVVERTAQQEMSLAYSLEVLSALYPQVANLLNGTSKQREQAIKIIESENKANQALLKATELAANGKMNAEGDFASYVEKSA